MKNRIVTFIKGFIIGGTMLVPGFSGGTMAIILGIYEELITSVSGFFRNVKKNTAFLALFSTGGIAGMLMFSKSILSLLDAYRMPVLYFFIGAVIGGIPMIIKSCGLKRLNMTSALYVIAGAVAVLSLALIPKGIFNPDKMFSVSGFLILLAAGFFAAIALVLPGISVSFVLLILGIYEEIIAAMDSFNIPYLAVVGAGLVLGIITTTRALEYAMKNYTRPSYLIILGFVLGSVLPIFPGAPSGADVFICAVTFISGIALVQLLYLINK